MAVVPRDHVVTFYERDDELVASVASFVGDGLDAGEAGILLATATHLHAIEDKLHRCGFDIELARLAGTLVSIDAEAARARHSAAGAFDASALIGELGDLIARVVGSGRRVRMFGELVALLWDVGHVMAAIELEDDWNRLCTELPFCLLCAYPRSIDAAGAAVVADVCCAHAAVIGDGREVDAIVVARAEHVRFFPCDVRSPGMARRFVTQVLRGWGRADLVENASLVTAELATNAVLHARSDLVVALSRHGDGVRVSVRDGSSAIPAVSQPTVDSVSGRGLRLVGALARDWGAEHVRSGKVVWAELE